MNCKLCSEQLQGYLNGELSPVLQAEVKAHLSGCTVCQQELEQYRQMDDLFGELPEEEPDMRLRHSFKMMLAAEQSKQKQESTPRKQTKNRTLWPQWSAAAVLLFVCGLMAGNTFQPFSNDQEVQALRQEVVQMKSLVVQSMLQQHSASDRIQAVSNAVEVPQASSQLMKTLIHTVHNDENVNVRLAAVEALYNYRNEAAVRKALIQALEEQEDVIVQLSIIELLVKMQEKKALPVMEKMLEKEETNEIVRHKLQEGIGRMI